MLPEIWRQELPQAERLGGKEAVHGAGHRIREQFIPIHVLEHGGQAIRWPSIHESSAVQPIAERFGRRGEQNGQCAHLVRDGLEPAERLAGDGVVFVAPTREGKPPGRARGDTREGLGRLRQHIVFVERIFQADIRWPTQHRRHGFRV